MSLIKCPECGKEISDKASSCPECGYSLKNNKKNMKGIIVTIVIFLVIVAGVVTCLTIQNEKKHKQIIADINKTIQKLYEGTIPSQEEFDKAVLEFEQLPEKDKMEIENSKFLDDFKEMDLNNIIKIENEIKELDESTEFSKIIEIKKEYDSLNKYEKKCIDITKLNSAMELSDTEKVALTVCKNVRSCMKSKDDFKVQEVTVKDDLAKMKYYWVCVKYSGTNSFGGNMDKTSYFAVDSNFKDPFFALGTLSGNPLESTTMLNAYIGSEQPEVTIDVDKISYYLDQE